MKHKMSGTRFYNIWCSMKQRCFYPKHRGFKNYGGRGVTVCKEWLVFNRFFKDMHKRYKAHSKKYGEKNTTIDRINTKGNYCKENCKWSTQQEQQVNRTNNHLITYKGEIKTISQWAKKLGFRRGILESREKLGWNIEQILSTPKYTVINRRKLTKDHKERIKQSMLKHFRG